VPLQRALSAPQACLLRGDLRFDLHHLLLHAGDALLQRAVLDLRDALLLRQIGLETVTPLAQLRDRCGLNFGRDQRTVVGRQDEQGVSTRNALSFLDLPGDHRCRARRIDSDHALGWRQVPYDVGLVGVLTPECERDHGQRDDDGAGSEKGRGERAYQRHFAERPLACEFDRLSTEQGWAHGVIPSVDRVNTARRC